MPAKKTITRDEDVLEEIARIPRSAKVQEIGDAVLNALLYDVRNGVTGKGYDVANAMYRLSQGIAGFQGLKGEGELETADRNVRDILEMVKDG